MARVLSSNIIVVEPDCTPSATGSLGHGEALGEPLDMLPLASPITRAVQALLGGQVRVVRTLPPGAQP